MIQNIKIRSFIKCVKAHLQYINKVSRFLLPTYQVPIIA
jgi:hypothetical protein